MKMKNRRPLEGTTDRCSGTSENAIAITGAAGAAISVDPPERAGPAAIIVETAIGTAPDATLPIRTHRDIDFPTRVELEARSDRRRSALGGDSGIDDLGTPVHNAERS